MNSSSAYSNVLNTSPVAPTVNNTPRRDLSDDSSSDEFHQALQNARADMRAEDDRNTKAETVNSNRNTSLKKAQLRSDDQQQTVASDQAQSTKAGDAKSVDGKKTGASKKAAVDDKDAVDEKNPTDATNQLLNKPADDKATCSLINADLGQLTLDADGSTEKSITDDVDKLALDAKTISVDPSLALKTTEKTVAETAAGEASADKVATGLLATSKNISAGDAIQDGDSKVSDKDASSAEKSQLVVDGTDALSINPLAVDAASAALTASTSGNTNPAADAQAAFAAITAEAVKSTNGTKPVAGDASTTLTADDPQASVLTGDPKSGFEKMLQAMVAANMGQQSQDSSSQSSSTQSASNQSSTATTPVSVIESLARTIDSQTPAARSFVVQTSVPVTVGQPQWSQAVGEKVLWLAAQNVSSAEIRLDPPDLGPMQVKVSVNQDQTNVSFTSHHPVVREMLDQNLHRLRDMFTEQGLNLGSVDVSDKSFSRQQGEGKGQHGSGGAADAMNEEETPIAVSTIVQQRLVDHYA